MDFKIRPARKDDLTTCAKIVMEEFNKQGEEFTPQTSFGRVEYLFGRAKDYCFVLELGGDIIGLIFCEKFVYAKGDYIWIGEFAINEEYRGKGFGVQALKFIEEFSRKNGINVLGLMTNIKERAVELYIRNGFKKTDFMLLEKELKS
jgi:ribosomal protein S18 acetylase RimI-like enzyme